jgi:EAL and modified HD-GYP domain-containing signal transduction protein
MEQKMIDIFVGRLPIYTPSLEVFGYELLYRAKDNTRALVTDGEKATSQVIFNTFIEIGIGKIAEDKLAFLKVDRSYIVGKLPLPFPREQIVLEIPQRMELDEELLVALIKLRNDHYWICLEDRPDQSLDEKVVNSVNILKINIHQIPVPELRERVQRYRKFNARLLAKRVQTQEEFETCKELGFDFYQGYFLSKPRVVSGRRLPANRFSLLKLLSCLYDPDVDMRELEELIRQDVSLSYRLLRMVNSAYYALDTKVESIRHALVILGLKQIRSWLTILAMSEVNDRSTTLMSTALIRGKMCELLAVASGYKQEDRFFTVGLLSILDAIMDLPMSKVLESLPLTDDLNTALQEHAGLMGTTLAGVIAYESGEWGEIENLDTKPGVLRDAYLSAIAWASEVSRKVQI